MTKKVTYLCGRGSVVQENALSVLLLFAATTSLPPKIKPPHTLTPPCSFKDTH